MVSASMWCMGWRRTRHLTDNPENPDWKFGQWPFIRFKPEKSLQHPDVYAYIREMREVVDEYPGDRVLIGETFHLNDLQQFMRYYDECRGCQLPFNFQLIVKDWNPVVIREFVEAYEQELQKQLPEAWPNWVLGNHDQHRIATRAGGMAQARLAQVLLLTLRGTPTCYYGDEIGMTDVEIRVPRDPYGIRVPGAARPGAHAHAVELRQTRPAFLLSTQSRSGCRLDPATWT